MDRFWVRSAETQYVPHVHIGEAGVVNGHREGRPHWWPRVVVATGGQQESPARGLIWGEGAASNVEGVAVHWRVVLEGRGRRAGHGRNVTPGLERRLQTGDDLLVWIMLVDRLITTTRVTRSSR
jgi:hypothetical protein